MSKLQNYIRFLELDSGTQFTPNLVGMVFFNKKQFEIKEISELQAKLECKIFFDLIRLWNKRQVDPPQGSLNPEPLVMEMALT